MADQAASADGGHYAWISRRTGRIVSAPSAGGGAKPMISYSGPPARSFRQILLGAAVQHHGDAFDLCYFVPSRVIDSIELPGPQP